MILNLLLHVRSFSSLSAVHDEDKLQDVPSPLPSPSPSLSLPFTFPFPFPLLPLPTFLSSLHPPFPSLYVLSPFHPFSLPSPFPLPPSPSHLPPPPPSPYPCFPYPPSSSLSIILSLPSVSYLPLPLPHIPASPTHLPLHSPSSFPFPLYPISPFPSPYLFPSPSPFTFPILLPLSLPLPSPPRHLTLVTRHVDSTVFPYPDKTNKSLNVICISEDAHKLAPFVDAQHQLASPESSVDRRFGRDEDAEGEISDERLLGVGVGG
ncbi:uncharacterized protein [Palaemon carinicauda]|uniref:uncharacterized protein n=1 Tax=Palaemon carinicauda TaxID=392227 RepID=UPI0035B601FE